MGCTQSKIENQEAIAREAAPTECCLMMMHESKNNNNNVAIHRKEKKEDDERKDLFPSQGRKNVIIDSDEDHDGKSKKASSSSSSSSSSVGSVSEDEKVETDQNKRPFLYSLIPPSYLKPKPSKAWEAPKICLYSLIPPPYLKLKPSNNKIESNLEKISDSKARSVRRRTLKHTNSVPPQPTTWEEPKMPNNNAAKHVHPKLPHYDHLAARLVSIKGRYKKQLH